MTTQDLGRVGGDLGDLFEHSPAVPARTSPAAEIGFLLGLVAVVTSPFTLTYGLSVVLAALGLVVSIVGLAQASRSGVAGGTLAASGLVLCLAALALVGLRYAGLHTAFGDSLVPGIHSALSALTKLVPSP